MEYVYVMREEFLPRCNEYNKRDTKNNKDSKAMITVKLINPIRTSCEIMTKPTAMVRIFCILVVHCTVPFELKNSVSTPSAHRRIQGGCSGC